MAVMVTEVIAAAAFADHLEVHTARLLFVNGQMLLRHCQQVHTLTAFPGQGAARNLAISTSTF
jgi:hypothetical protein